MSAPGPRLVPLQPDRLDPDQRRLYDAVLASPRARGGARRLIVRDDGTLTGPFDAWLRTPAVGAHLERLGMALRADTALPAAAREIAVLVVAGAWSADFEWWVHGIVARAEGVPEAAIEAIGAGRPAVLDDPAGQAAVEQVAFADRFGEPLFGPAQEGDSLTAGGSGVRASSQP